LLSKRRNAGATPERRNLMVALLKKLVQDESAQDLAEYGIALAVIGAGAAVAAVAIAGYVNTLWSTANSVIESAVP
jgi:Flp pilus assembly pilin Flp